jgi:glucokinase
MPKLGVFFDEKLFRSHFEDKVDYEHYMERIPTYLITHPYPALLGLMTL